MDKRGSRVKRGCLAQRGPSLVSLVPAPPPPPPLDREQTICHLGVSLPEVGIFKARAQAEGRAGNLECGSHEEIFDKAHFTELGCPLPRH